MTLTLVSNFANDKQNSMLGFLACLEHQYKSANLNFTTVSPVARFSRYSITRHSQKWQAYIDKYLLFPRKLRKVAVQSDIVHILDHGNSMYVPHVRHKTNVVTCHDMLAIRASQGEIPGWELGPTGLKYQSLILSGLKQSHHIVSVSQATQIDVNRLTGLPSERLSTIYNGFYQEVKPLPLEQVQKKLANIQIEGPFFLHVGGDSPYKNRTGLIEIYLEMVKQEKNLPKLVLAGRLPNIKVKELISQAPSNQIQVVASPDTETLVALYQMASALIFPSTYEGFGLPIIEAQALSCPVFTSNRAPMTEVSGNAAVYFDPLKPMDAASIILNSLDQATAMKEAGLENIKRFSASLMAKNYIDLYKHLLGESVA